MRIRICRFLSGIALLATMASASAWAHGIVLGVCLHVTNDPSEQKPQLNLARRVGFDAVRDDFLWKYVEKTKGLYTIPPSWDQFIQASRRRGIKPLVILDYGNPLYDGGNKPRSRGAIEGFVRYATFVVKHFAGRVHYFEIWNEWDTHTGGFPSGNARDYAKLFDAVYPAVKKVDPSAVFLASASAGGNNRWYKRIAELGVAARADAVAVHPYVYPRHSNVRTAFGSNEAERGVQQVISIEKTMRRFSGGKEIPIYITEIGWPSNVGRLGLTESVVSLQAQRALLMYAALPYVHGVWWYDLRDGCADNRNYLCRFGVAHQDLSLKLEGYGIQAVAPIIKHNNLTMSSETDLSTGLVVLKNISASASKVIAWYAGPTPGSNATESGGYVVSCSPQLKISRGGSTRSALKLDAAPAMFTFRSGKCVRKDLSASKSILRH